MHDVCAACAWHNIHIHMYICMHMYKHAPRRAQVRFHDFEDDGGSGAKLEEWHALAKMRPLAPPAHKPKVEPDPRQASCPYPPSPQPPRSTFTPPAPAPALFAALRIRTAAALLARTGSPPPSCPQSRPHARPRHRRNARPLHRRARPRPRSRSLRRRRRRLLSCGSSLRATRSRCYTRTESGKPLPCNPMQSRLQPCLPRLRPPCLQAGRPRRDLRRKGLPPAARLRQGFLGGQEARG